MAKVLRWFHIWSNPEEICIISSYCICIYKCLLRPTHIQKCSFIQRIPTSKHLRTLFSYLCVKSTKFYRGAIDTCFSNSLNSIHLSSGKNQNWFTVQAGYFYSFCALNYQGKYVMFPQYCCIFIFIRLGSHVHWSKMMGDIIYHWPIAFFFSYHYP